MKRKNSSFPLFLDFRPHGHFFTRGPAPQPSPAAVPARSRASAVRPSKPRRPTRPPTAHAPPAPSRCPPGPHLSAPSPSPRGSATARARRCSNRRHDARRGRVAPLHGLVKREPRPSAHPCCLFPALLSHLLGPKKPQQPPQHSPDPPCASSRSRRLAVASGPQPSFAVM